MSTRSYVGAGPLSKFKGFYIHSNGYPDERIPQLSAWLLKNGFSQFVKTLNKTRGAGGSSFNNSLDPDSLLDNPYNDGSSELMQGEEEALDQDFTYIVSANKIDFYNFGKKLGTINWKMGH